MAARKKTRTTDAVAILHRRFFEGKPEMLALLDEARVNDEIARRACRLREDSGLTPNAIARLAGMKTSDVIDLEDGNYAGNGMALLRRIAAALNRRLEIRFVKINRPAASRR